METKLKPGQILVRYWRGTREREGIATTYTGAKRIACRNKNANSPTFYAHDGTQLYDDGFGLIPEDSDTYYV